MMTYKIKLSSGDAIPIDEDEIQNVIAGLKSKQFVVVRQGMFNPAYFVSIVKDRKRQAGMNYVYGKDDFEPAPSKDKPLSDIFAGVREKLKLSNSQNPQIG